MSFATRSEGLVQRRHVAQSGTTAVSDPGSDIFVFIVHR